MKSIYKNSYNKRYLEEGGNNIGISLSVIAAKMTNTIIINRIQLYIYYVSNIIDSDLEDLRSHAD